MPNNIAAIKNYTNVIDQACQRASVSGCLTSGRRMVRAGRNAKEIEIAFLGAACSSAISQGSR